MSILKSPFLSLGAKGSIAKAVTVQERQGTTFIRTKPIPAYRYTLLQAYQRWLYEDYAYLWTQQSTATKQEYATTGSRHHLTGFQYWMKYHLTKLPDIAGMWHLDEASGAFAYDSSRNQNHGTIIGASPATGIIDRARLFDGVNDHIDVPNTPSLSTGDELSLETFIKPYDMSAHLGSNYRTIIHKKSGAHYHLAVKITGFFEAHIAAVVASYAHAFDSSWHHFVATAKSNDFIRLYWDGYFQVAVPLPVVIPSSTDPLYIGNDPTAGFTARPFDGIIDHVIIRNRVLDPTEILRHSLRRYPQ